MLRVEHVDVVYGNGFQVLWDVSIEVARGEIVCLLGANGAGKSSLMNTISGLVRPSSGRIVLDGQDVTGRPAHKMVPLGLAHVLERRKLFNDMTVMENLLLGASSKRAWPIRDETLEWVLDVLPLAGALRHETAGALSGGQQQVVALARGLMSRPSLLLCDEPLLGLSPVAAGEVIEVFGRIRSEGITIAVIEQNVEHALELSDRGYVLESGHVVLSGTSDELLRDQLVKDVFLGGR